MRFRSIYSPINRNAMKYNAEMPATFQNGNRMSGKFEVVKSTYTFHMAEGKSLNAEEGSLYLALEKRVNPSKEAATR